jgi:regulator of protease activity HflC (stomatin/prohibitin superfamily)
MTIVTRKLMTTKVIVKETERALVSRNGKFEAILDAGKHSLSHYKGFQAIGRPTIESFPLNAVAVSNEWVDTLIRTKPELVTEHLDVFETALDEVALISRSGKLHSVMRPETKRVFWKDAGPWMAETVTLTDELTVEAKMSRRLMLISTDVVKRFKVEHGQVGMLHVDGAFVKTLKPGGHCFWSHGKVITVKIIDTRDHALDVTGQEVLTKDRVSIRVNLAATFRVVDPVKAVTEVKDFEDALYRSLGHAFRKTLSAKTLDEVLAKKGMVDSEAAKEVREAMAKAGLEVSAITLKDIILPGEMRDILNTVVTAEKEAEANTIRRREESAATRTLLNTAKVMADNPAMMRLKELEALESIAEKVGTLTIHSGTKGLMEDIVSLSEPKGRKAS